MDVISHEVIFLPIALNEAKEAYVWYEKKEVGLGEDFYRALSVAVSFISKNPKTPRKVYRTYRRVLLRRFPYALFYHITKNEIYIYSVFHYSQNPKKWEKILRGRENE